MRRFASSVAQKRCVNTLSSRLSINVVWEDDNYFFVNKPPGISVAGEIGGLNFHDQVKEYAKENYPSGFQHNLLHRLDKGTSGLMVYAKTVEAAAHYLSLQETKGAIQKDYFAITHGLPPKKTGRVAGAICKSKDKLTFVIHKAKRDKHKRTSKLVLTTYRLLATIDSTVGIVSLLSLRLFSGRKHQIRASCRKLGCSIVGDKRYGGLPWNSSNISTEIAQCHTSDGCEGGGKASSYPGAKVPARMMLHAHRISFISLPTSSNAINGEMPVEGRLYDVKCDPEPNLLWTSLFSAALTAKRSR